MSSVLEEEGLKSGLESSRDIDDVHDIDSHAQGENSTTQSVVTEQKAKIGDQNFKSDEETNDKHVILSLARRIRIPTAAHY